MKYLHLIYLLLICHWTTTGSQAQICVGTPGEVQWMYWRELPDDLLGELYAVEYYPGRPDGSRTISSLRSPQNFDNLYGSYIRGFISAPESGDVYFNITADDDAEFYLSTGEDPANMERLAWVDGWTSVEQHDKYPETQNSTAVSLTAGEYYYFEIRQVDGGGGDHVNIWWKTNFTDPDNWQYVSSAFIYDVGCQEELCPERGTPCDDGDPDTEDDKEDGFCHCIGVPIDRDPCIGSRQDIEAYYFDNISGGELNDLFEHEKFPVMPDRGEILPYLGIPNANNADNFGTIVQGYLTVPVSGQYQFNITGNSEAIFFLSSDADPVNKQAHQILVDYSTGPVEHDKFIFQQTAFLSLEKDKFYYYEINHKESTGSEHFGIFWKTPFMQEGQWKRISSFYLFDYACELSCISDGTPCDDGDPYTNDDVYANCECTGTPCNGPDCDDPLASYQSYPKCGLTDQLDNATESSWLSCGVSASPNPQRGNGHWIQYAFDTIYQLYNTQVWNYNVLNETEKGFEKVVVDYSQDGNTWSELGIYYWDLASGAPDYSGFIGPYFGGAGARYVLITSLDVAGPSGCRGISKVSFHAGECPGDGEPCNDNDPLTVDDRIVDCNCIGTPALGNDCVEDILVLDQSPLSTNNYSAAQRIESGSMIPEGEGVSFVAGEEIQLMPGFEAMQGASFIADIMACGTLIARQELHKVLQTGEGIFLQVSQIAGTEDVLIEFMIPRPEEVTLRILDGYQKPVHKIIRHAYRNAGFYRKIIRTTRLEKPPYLIEIQAGIHRKTTELPMAIENE